MRVMFKRMIPAVCALAMLSAAGCAENTDSSSVQDSSAVTEVPAESSVDDLSSAVSGADAAPRSETGERLKAVYDILSAGSYTFECELTGTNVPEAIDIIKIVSGDESYQLQKERLGSHGTVTFSGKTYDFDYVCGMYRESTEPLQPGIIEQIVKGNIPRTEAAAADDSYDVERYTYTGDTYITAADFFFDRKDGHLVKYTMTYTVEGKDDIVETRKVLRLDSEADTSVFNAYFADTLVNFDSMSEPQKLGFCQGLCATWGITADEMFELGINSGNLETIDYDTLFLLIHTYGKLHGGAEEDSSLSEPEESAESESGETADEPSAAERDDSSRQQLTQSEALIQ